MPFRARARREVRSPPISADDRSDAEIVALCASGDEGAWRALVSRYRRLVYTIPYRMGLDPSDADDVFQITFTRLAERVGTLKKPDRVRAWLVTTARRVSLSAAGRRRNLEQEAAATIADPADLPSEELDRLERQALVRLAMGRLGERCRRLLELLYYPDERSGHGRSYEAVAREMRIPVGSIGPTRMRCLKKLLVEYRELSKE